MLGCMLHALLLAKANSTQLIELHGRPAEMALAREVGMALLPREPSDAASGLWRTATGPSRCPSSSPTSLPREIFHSAEKGELQKVVKWLDQGGPVDALCSAPTEDARPSAFGLLHAAAGNGHLEMVRELLERGASVDLPSSLDATPLMGAAHYGHLSILLVLLQHSANPDHQDIDGDSGLMRAADQGQEPCVQALLRAKAHTELLDKDGRTALQWAEAKQGDTTIAKLIRQHAAPPQPKDGEPTVSSDASLPLEIYESARRGELQKVVKWLREGGLTDALCAYPTEFGQPSAFALLHAAATNGHVEMVRELLKRGASIDLQSDIGATPLMAAARYGHLSTLLLLLQHSANPDLQDIKNGYTALTVAADAEHEACVQALLRANANTELLDNQGLTARRWAEIKGRTAVAELIQQHACRSPGFGLALCAVLPLARPWMALSVVLGTIAAVAFSRTLTAGPGQHRAARQRRPHRPARNAKAHGRSKAKLIQQQAAPPQPPAAMALQAAQAVQTAMGELLVEEAAEQVKEQPPLNKSNKKEKAGRAAAPELTMSTAERAKALQAVIAGGGLSAHEVAPCEMAVPDQYMCSITAEIMIHPASTVRLCPRHPCRLSCMYANPPFTHRGISPCGLP